MFNLLISLLSIFSFLFLLACDTTNFNVLQNSLCSLTIHRNICFLLQSETWISLGNYMFCSLHKQKLLLSPHTIDRRARKQSWRILLTVLSKAWTLFFTLMYNVLLASDPHSLPVLPHQYILMDHLLTVIHDLNWTEVFVVIPFCAKTENCESFEDLSVYQI